MSVACAGMKPLCPTRRLPVRCQTGWRELTEETVQAFGLFWFGASSPVWNVVLTDNCMIYSCLRVATLCALYSRVRDVIFIVAPRVSTDRLHALFLGTLRDLLMWIKDNLLKERPELFVFEGSVYVITPRNKDP